MFSMKYKWDGNPVILFFWNQELLLEAQKAADNTDNNSGMPMQLSCFAITEPRHGMSKVIKDRFSLFRPDQYHQATILTKLIKVLIDDYFLR